MVYNQAGDQKDLVTVCTYSQSFVRVHDIEERDALSGMFLSPSLLLGCTLAHSPPEKKKGIGVRIGDTHPMLSTPCRMVDEYTLQVRARRESGTVGWRNIS